MQDVFEVMALFEGDDDIVIDVPTSRGSDALRSRSRRVEWNERLHDALSRLIGSDCVELKVPLLAS
jgi:hypothetical protein